MSPRPKVDLRVRNSRSISGFSLVELIAVIAIITILLALFAPAMRGFSATAGKKGAVTLVMNTLEQARAAALANGANVYVLLRQREFPNRDCIMVVREPSPWITDENGEPEPDKLVPLTRWIDLPEGVLLHKPDRGANVFDVAAWPAELERRKDEIPMSGGESLESRRVGVVWYQPNGSIAKPTEKDARIVVTEGVRDGSGAEALISRRKEAAAGFDVITLSRFTGRAQLDVSTLN